MNCWAIAIIDGDALGAAPVRGAAAAGAGAGGRGGRGAGPAPGTRPDSSWSMRSPAWRSCWRCWVELVLELAGLGREALEELVDLVDVVALEPDLEGHRVDGVER